MKRAFIFLLITIALLPACWLFYQHDAPDVIIETHHLSDLYKYINEDEYNSETLVMFDIDNTILTPPTDLGSDQWFYATLQHKLNEGLQEPDAIDAILPIYKQILMVTDYVPVEKQTVDVIKKLQGKNVTVIGLTARSLDLAYRTVEQLDNVGVIFDKNKPYECPIKYGSDRPALYIDGIIFTGNYHKGEVVAAWLKQIDYKPKKVIFIDDKLKNLTSVEKALHKRDFPFYGLRYNYLDERVKNFDWNKTQKELEQFLEKHPESRPIPAY